MQNLKIYCLTLSNSHYEKILEKNYIPVGLGNTNYADKWLTYPPDIDRDPNKKYIFKV